MHMGQSDTGQLTAASSGSVGTKLRHISARVGDWDTSVRRSHGVLHRRVQKAHLDLRIDGDTISELFQNGEIGHASCDSLFERGHGPGGMCEQAGGGLRANAGPCGWRIRGVSLSDLGDSQPRQL